MKKYTIIDWRKNLVWLIPPILRRQTHYEWLKSLLAPLAKIYDETLYKMQHTGQVIYLEKVLNETFNPNYIYNPNYTVSQKRYNRLIYIEESTKPKLHYVYLNQEYTDLNIEKSLIYSNNEFNGSIKPLYLANFKDYTGINYANFRVFIPKHLKYNQTEDDKYIRRSSSIINEPNSELTDLNELNNKLVYSPRKNGLKGIDVHTIKYHDILNFFKLAGKTYESYSYETSGKIIIHPIDILEEQSKL